MTFVGFDSGSNQTLGKKIAIVMMITASLSTVNFAAAANVGFTGNVVAPAHRTLMPEKNDIVTFTNQVGIRFRSENASNEPIKMKLSVRDSAGQKILPVSIMGNVVVKPKNRNLVTIVLPMGYRNNEVFELCLQHINAAKDVLNRSCSKLSVARMN